MRKGRRKKAKMPTSSLLSRKRLPTLPRASLSAKATRKVISRHHLQQKRRHQALAKGDAQTAEETLAEITRDGGIDLYQHASALGQSNERGGDSSRILLNWLESHRAELPGTLRLLEIGALTTKNACSRSSLFETERIDLNAREEGILKQDFMERPLPSADREQFDLISLSLVLNYVPEPAGRGRMLQRTTQFLRRSQPPELAMPSSELLPSLFLVLPAPCITNSRYLDEERLTDIMSSLGYVMLRRKISTKLVYYLWKFEGGKSLTRKTFRKVEVNGGRTRNNFAITME